MELNDLSDIIALTETKILKSQTNTPNALFGYSFVHTDTTTNAGGVDLYIKNNIYFEIRHDLLIYSNDCECIWIEIELKDKHNIIGVVYKHPTYKYDEFQDSFLKTLHKLNESKHN